MKHYLYRVTGVLLLSVCFGHAQHRSFDVRDSIEMTTFSDPSGLIQNAKASFSPDGQHALIVTTRGTLKDNQIESTIWIWNRNAIEGYLQKSTSAFAPAPKKLASISATPDFHADRPYAPSITDVRWSADSRRVFFLGYDSHGDHRLDQISLDHPKIHHLTPAGFDVRQFSIQGHILVYTALSHIRDKHHCAQAFNPTVQNSAKVLTGRTLDSILFPGRQGTSGAAELGVIQDGGPSRIVAQNHDPTIHDPDYFGTLLSISPNGYKVVVSLPVKNVPGSWSQYIPASGFENRRIQPAQQDLLSPQNPFRLRQYAVIDLKTSTTTRLIHAPQATPLAYQDRTEAVWSKDGQHLLLTNTFLPLMSGPSESNVNSQRACAVASLALASLKTQCVVLSRDAPIQTVHDPEPMRLQSASFGTTSDDVLLEFAYHGKRSMVEHYRFTQRRWKLLDMETRQEPPHTDLSLTIRQSLNQRPVLWATNPGSGRGKELWDPNSQFESLKFGEASIFHWKDASGYEWTGGLIKPVGYDPSKRYPLVIQTHGFVPFEFITDGQFPTAMAARPLASAGFVVLQVYDRWDHVDQYQESLDQLSGYQAAIAQLSSDHLIDPRRVGIIGFSRTCWYVEEALIRGPHLFAAATISDGVDYSYLQYLQFGEGHSFFQNDFEKINGSKPFGIGLKQWTTRSPGFNLDKMMTPLRIEAIGPSAVLSEWEIYAALRRLGRPVDFVYIPRGQHILQKPWNRLASQQGDVDWFRFWLQGYEDPSPQKASQYRRWTTLERLQEIPEVAK